MAKKSPTYPTSIGCFEIALLEPGKWRVKNTLNQFVHCTYGTFEEIQVVLEKQSLLWKEKTDNFLNKTGRNAPLNAHARRGIAKATAAAALKRKARVVPGSKGLAGFRARQYSTAPNSET